MHTRVVVIDAGLHSLRNGKMTNLKTLIYVAHLLFPQWCRGGRMADLGNAYPSPGLPEQGEGDPFDQEIAGKG